MTDIFIRLYQTLNPPTVILVALSVILFSGFLVTRLTKLLKLPNVTGYIVAGVLIGPYVLNAVPQGVIDGMGFMSDIALAFIAFGVGKFFKREVIRATGKGVIVITVLESLIAGVLVTLAMHFLFHMEWDFSMVLGAIATATAPASTMMTINQYHARGGFVNTLLQVVALDDVVCLLAFSVISAVTTAGARGDVGFFDIALPIVYNVVAILIGLACGFLLSKLLSPKRSKDNRLILVIAMLLGISGLCAAFGISPLLSCMVFGAAYINITYDKELYHQINNFTPPVMSMFFILSGMNLDLSVMGTVGVIGISYFFIRIVGKYAGTYLGSLFTGADKKIRNFLGLALIPQAGVAIGLAFSGQRNLPPELGNLMLAIILFSSVFYELIGPVCAKSALILSGSISKEALAAGGAVRAAPKPDDKLIDPVTAATSTDNPEELGEKKCPRAADIPETPEQYFSEQSAEAPGQTSFEMHMTETETPACGQGSAPRQDESPEDENRPSENPKPPEA